MERELDVQRLRILVEVAHSGSIAEAARRLAFTPSALSQQIAKLEKDLDVRLLERRATGVVLTPVGALVLAQAERVVGELRRARAEIGAVIAEQPLRLALGAFATAGQVLVPSALAALRDRHPRAELSLVDIEPPGGYGLVTSGDLDALITHRYHPGVPAAPHPGLERHKLLDDPLRLVVPAGHPLADRPAHRPVGLRELAGESWISGAPGIPNRVCLEGLSRQAEVGVRVAYESADYHAILALITAGLGVALVPSSVLTRTDRSRLALHRLAGCAPAREISIVHQRRPTTLVRELIAFLHTAARQTAAEGG
ncbi:LysR substrate-binding domain-containing protein [Kitasatospora sp. NPDC048538]|uniref:LysR family transcriptional regulator n=1 Tax=unclassified Kitasatospora TaxID=2633591 RepID=UPI0033FCDEC6